MMTGTVLRTGGGAYRVVLDGGRRVEASLRGRLKLEDRSGDRVVIGDRVRVAGEDDDSLAIEEVLPREREIVRRAPGGRKAKVVAANVERMVAVLAAAAPDPRRELVDRLLVVAEANGLEGILVVNKIDLETENRSAALTRVYGGLGYPVVRTSARTGEGIDSLRSMLCRGSSALVGPSGVGKSSLLNVVQPGLDLRIAAVSERARRGRHTTVSARLIELECGGMVADTPGFSDVGLWGVEPDALDECFPEFRPHLGDCRFRTCSHLHEPGCAIRRALDEGTIDARRYRSYERLWTEAQEATAPPWRRS